MKKTMALSCAASSLVSALVTALLISVAVPAAVRAQTPGIRARQFLAVGSDGSDRGLFGELTSPQGTTGSALAVRQNGVNRALVATGLRDPAAAALTLTDTAGNRRIALQLATGFEPQSVGDLDRIAVFDKEQRVRVHIGVRGDGTPFIDLLDADGNVTWSAR